MPNLKPFQDELPIPVVVNPVVASNTKHLAIKAKVKNIKVHHDLPTTEVWSYQLDQGTIIYSGKGNTYIGPTILVNRGDMVRVSWENKIDFHHTLPYEVVKVPYTNGDSPIPQNIPGQDKALPEDMDLLRRQTLGLHAALVTHLHGGRTQADSDGWPDNTALSGQIAQYTYHNDQAATLLWYHDHTNHVTRLNVFAGLAGAWLIRDTEEASLKLPEGEYELPLIIQDRNLAVDSANAFTGAFLHKTEVGEGPAEFFGPYTLVNGKIWPKAEVKPQLYRFRVLNGSNARTYRLLLLNESGLSQHANVWQIGCDQGLMHNKTAISETGLVLAPGERVDLLIDFTSFTSQNLYLWNTAEAPFGNASPITANPVAELTALLANPIAVNGNEIDRRPYPQIMRFDVKTKAGSSLDTLPADPLWRQPRPPLDLKADMPIRLMALIEKPPTGGGSETSMLVFWEYVQVTPKEPAPSGADIVNFTYIHPATNLSVTGQYWKAAEEFYDTLNWKIHLDDTEQWYIVNLSPDTHPIHVHLVDVHVNQRYAIRIQPPPAGTEPLVIDGNQDKLTAISNLAALPIDPDQTGPKDTVRVNPGEMIGLAIKFSPFCGKFMYHCHILEHEDNDMMRPFLIVPKWVPHHQH